MTSLLLFIVGLGALVAGAEMLVRGASRLAVALGLSPLVVGLTIVAFGTSSPEMAVSVQGAMSGRTNLAIGNAVGSNLFNVLFILGSCALITPLVVTSRIIRQEVPVLIGSALLLAAMALDGDVTRGEAAVLLASLLGYTGFLVVQSRRAHDQPVDADCERRLGRHEDLRWDDRTWVQGALVLAGLALLVLGSEWLVTAAVGFARALGVSELVIGLTIVAAGTSAPEVAASLMALLRGERDMAVGNVIGSNVFNALGVAGLAGLFAPVGLQVPSSVIAFDLPAMVIVSIACLPVFFSNRRIGRWEGLMFLGYYAAYLVWLIMDARGHDALADYRAVLLYVALPFTAVTLLVVTWQGERPRIGP